MIEEIGRRVTGVTDDPKETMYLFQRLSMAIQRGNALPTPLTKTTSRNPSQSTIFPSSKFFSLQALCSQALKIIIIIRKHVYRGGCSKRYVGRVRVGTGPVV